jgi:uncharacterized protein YecE (DUF72 family)
MTHAADVHLGTSAWHYRRWIGASYRPGTRHEDFLDYYVRRFRTVEINNTFYRLPSQHAAIEWLAGSPSSFVFAAKGSRFITHKDPETPKNALTLAHLVEDRRRAWPPSCPKHTLA